MDRHTGRLRLRKLQEINEAKADEMAQERERFSRIDGEDAPRVVESFNLFETPEHVAERMAAMAPAGARVLEPSAGLGRLVRAAMGRGCEVVAVEVSPDCCAELYRIDGVALRQRDFLTCSPEDVGGPFDAVLMNPPFKQGRDIKHIRHARTMLRPGGVLVALCFDGVKQRRELKPIADTWELLPPGSFKASGTRADVALLTMT